MKNVIWQMENETTSECSPDCLARGPQGAPSDQFVDHRVEVILRDPFDHRDADRVAEAEEGLICRRGNFVIIRAHQPGAFARSKESHKVFSLPRLEQYLPAAAATRRAQTARYAVGSQLGHGLALSDAAKDRAVAPPRAGYHSLRRLAMARTHLVEQVLRALGAPPFGRVIGQVFENLFQLDLAFGRRWQLADVPIDILMRRYELRQCRRAWSASVGAD